MTRGTQPCRSAARLAKRLCFISEVKRVDGQVVNAIIAVADIEFMCPKTAVLARLPANVPPHQGAVSRGSSGGTVTIATAQLPRARITNETRPATGR